MTASSALVNGDAALTLRPAAVCVGAAVVCWAVGFGSLPEVFLAVLRVDEGDGSDGGGGGGGGKGRVPVGRARGTDGVRPPVPDVMAANEEEK